METRKPYPTDLTDAQWKLLEPSIPTPKEGGRKVTYSRREIVNGILYITKTGCHWRCLPHDLPPWSLVHYYFWHWKRTGVWEQANAALRGKLRTQLGRNEQPSAAVMDSQTVKTTEKGGRAATTATRK
jgi:transposase